MKLSMKRFLVVVSMLCMTFFALMLVTACGETCEHNYGEWQQPKNTTCIDPGIKTRTCLYCGDVQEAEADPVHDWDGGEVTTPATCTKEGVKTYTCLNNSEHKKTDSVKPLGHAFSVKFTVDESPTLTSEGWESQHCNRCEATQNGRSIPKLSESGIMYRIKVNRSNGYSFFSYPRVTIVSSAGEQVYEGLIHPSQGEFSDIATSTIEISLPLDEYKVYLSNIPEGFDVKEYYTVSAADGIEPFDTPEKYPELDIRLESHLREWVSGVPVIDQGTVLNDFDIKSFNKGTVKLSELLAEKKVVVFNFYFADCPACILECEYFMEVCNKYKDEIAVVAFHTRNYGQSRILSMSKSYLGYSEDFYYVEDQNYTVFSKFDGYTKGTGGVPQTAVIDRGGYYVTHILTMSNATWFDTAIQACLYGEDAKDVVSSVSITMDVIIPEKKSYSL